MLGTYTIKESSPFGISSLTRRYPQDVYGVGRLAQEDPLASPYHSMTEAELEAMYMPEELISPEPVPPVEAPGTAPVTNNVEVQESYTSAEEIDTGQKKWWQNKWVLGIGGTILGAAALRLVMGKKKPKTGIGMFVERVASPVEGALDWMGDAFSAWETGFKKGQKKGERALKEIKRTKKRVKRKYRKRIPKRTRKGLEKRVKRVVSGIKKRRKKAKAKAK